MQSTEKTELVENLRNPVWLRSWVLSHLCDRLKKIEERYHHWESDRESESPETEIEFFPEEGVALFELDNHLAPPDRPWSHRLYERKEIVVFESGTISVLGHHDSAGTVRSDFEAHAGFVSRDAMCFPFQEEDYAILTDKVAEALLSAAEK